MPNEAKVTCLNNYCPVALTSVAMKCFERLVMAHINSILPDTLDPLQFAYCPNISTDYAISITLHTALSHQDKRNTYVRMLFIDYSSAFNTIVPSKLINKLRILGLNTSLCKALNIVKDPSHPSHRLFSLLPHGKWYRSAKSRTKKASQQFLPPSHKTLEHVIKWLPRLFN